MNRTIFIAIILLCQISCKKKEETITPDNTLENKIKTEYEFNCNTGFTISIRTYKYDKNQRLIEFTDSEGYEAKRTYLYEDLFVYEKVYLYPNTLFFLGENRYTLNSNGLAIRKDMRSPDNNIFYPMENYEYNLNGNMITNNIISLNVSTVYIYDSDNNLKTAKYYSTGDSTITTYFYYPNTINYGNNENIHSYYSLPFLGKSSKNLVFKKKWTDNNGYFKTEQFAYEFDSIQRVIRKEMIDPQGVHHCTKFEY